MKKGENGCWVGKMHILQGIESFRYLCQLYNKREEQPALMYVNGLGEFPILLLIEFLSLRETEGIDSMKELMFPEVLKS